MRYLLAFATLVLVFSACSKAPENSPSKEDDLRGGKWKMVAGTQRLDPAIGMDTIYHYYDSLALCAKDDYLVFSENMDGTQNSGEKCDPSEPDVVDFKWFLENNGSKINFYNATQTFLHQSAVSAPFVSFGPNEFTIRYVELMASMDAPGKNDTMTYTYTFRKQ